MTSMGTIYVNNAILVRRGKLWRGKRREGYDCPSGLLTIIRVFHEIRSPSIQGDSAGFRARPVFSKKLGKIVVDPLCGKSYNLTAVEESTLFVSGTLTHYRPQIGTRSVRITVRPRGTRRPSEMDVALQAIRETRVAFDSSFDAKEQVRQAIDIVDLFGKYNLSLRRQGRSFVALCPWHDDTRPSLQVNPERQSWKCWPCDVGGDIFSFVMKMEGVDFPEALAMLADRAGIKIESNGATKTLKASTRLRVQPAESISAHSTRRRPGPSGNITSACYIRLKRSRPGSIFKSAA